MRKVSIRKTFVAAVLFSLFCSCGGHQRHAENAASEGGDTLTTYAKYLKIIERPDGLAEVKIINPWDSTVFLSRYLIGDSGALSKVDVPEGYQVITTPINSAIVYSGVHAQPIEEIGALEVITGVADAQYFNNERIKSRIKAGTIKDIGNSMSPSLERIVALSPDVVILSPYENSGHGILDKSGITIIDMADYMENTPLGRAEWIKLLGLLTGRYDAADSVFNEVKEQYEKLRVEPLENKRPLVLNETPYSGIWYQPGSRSYMAALTRDAGGRSLLDGENESVGSVQMDIANVVNRAVDADVWMIKTVTPLTSADIRALVPLSGHIKAFNQGKVFEAVTSNTLFYEDLAFHPERILRDYVNIFAGRTDSLTYFRKID